MSPASRVRAGTPDGGRFAPAEHTEATITLDDLEALTGTTPAQTTPCPACDGDCVVGLDICPDCGGLGTLTA